ncbi:MAG: hypothetical protein AAGD00_07025 [Planctomycetota bacterium]
MNESAEPKKRLGPVTRVAALLLAMCVGFVLQFAAAGKLMSPSPYKTVELPTWLTTDANGAPVEVLADYLIAGGELVIVLLVLSLSFWKVTWLGVATFFAGLAGYAGYFTYVAKGPCGCFGGLWTPPEGFSFTMDLAIVALSMIVAYAMRARTLLLVCVIAASAAAATGYWYASTVPNAQTSTTNNAGRDAIDRLMDTDAMSDIREQAEFGGPVWAIFVHDPGCSTCNEMKPIIEQEVWTLEETVDPYFQIRMASIPEFIESDGIENWAWEQTPTVFLVDSSGQVMRDRVWGGKDAWDFVYGIADLHAEFSGQ